MKASKVVWAVVVVLVILGVGLYIADMVKKNPAEMDCILGLGPKDSPTLCYGWSQTDVPEILQ